MTGASLAAQGMTVQGKAGSNVSQPTLVPNWPQKCWPHTVYPQITTLCISHPQAKLLDSKDLYWIVGQVELCHQTKIGKAELRKDNSWSRRGQKSFSPLSRRLNVHSFSIMRSIFKFMFKRQSKETQNFDDLVNMMVDHIVKVFRNTINL